MNRILATLAVLISIFSISNIAKANEGYFFGGVKLFNYGVETSDLQEINTSLVALGFSSSTSSTDNSGVGFDFGVGYLIDDTFGFEVGYVNYGTLEINTTLTGPAEKVKTEIDGSGITFAGVARFGEADNYGYVKAGLHSWEFEGTVTASLGSSSEPLGTGTDPIFGIGYGAGGFIFGYDYYAIEDGDIGSLTLGYSSKF